MEQCLNGKVVQGIFGSGSVFTEVHTGICPTHAGFSITGQCGQHMIIIYWKRKLTQISINNIKTKLIQVLALIVHVSSMHVILEKNLYRLGLRSTLDAILS